MTAVVSPLIPCGECIDSGLWGSVIVRASHQLHLRDPASGKVVELYTCPAHTRKWEATDWLYMWCSL